MPYVSVAADVAGESSGLLQQEEHVSPAPNDQQGLQRYPGARAAVAVGGALAALACVGMFARSGRPLAISEGDAFQVKAFNPAGPTAQCPSMEMNMDYQDEVSGFGQSFDHIPTADLCCALCAANQQCQSFTWVQDAGLDDCPSQCWIKGGTGVKVPATGKVSGIPPQRMPLGQVPPGQGGQGNSLWCFSLMMPTGGEKDLLAWQFEHQASIFACDAYAVYSNQQIEVAPGVVTKIVESDLKCPYGGDSQSALNSWIFIAVWDKICDDGEYQAYSWVVKVDPDCVFFPNRLIQITPAYQGAQYLNNCKYGMHGPIEVFSSEAINVLAQEYAQSFDGKSPKRCVENQEFGQWGEDMFIDQCLSRILGLTNRPLEPRVVCEDHCECPDFYWCQKGSDRVAYHPFKTVDDYENCMANAMQDQKPAFVSQTLMSLAPAR